MTGAVVVGLMAGHVPLTPATVSIDRPPSSEGARLDADDPRAAAQRRARIKAAMEKRKRSAGKGSEGTQRGSSPPAPQLKFRGNEDYYETLGVERDATEKEITAAFRKVSLKNHPDKVPTTATDEQRAESLSAFQAAAEAYRVLGDGRSREAFNVALEKQNPKPASARGASGQHQPAEGESRPATVIGTPSEASGPGDTFQRYMCEQFGSEYAKQLNAYEVRLAAAREQAAALLESSNPRERREQLAKLKAEEARKTRLRRIAAQQTRDNAAWEMRAHFVRAREEESAREHANAERRKTFLREFLIGDAGARAAEREEEQRRAKQRVANAAAAAASHQEM